MQQAPNKHNVENGSCHAINILVEEWKKNVDLYIDQDRRNFNRISVFVLIHAGLLIFYGKMLSQVPFIPCLVAAIGLYVTRVTHKMSLKAHAYIILRKIQGMLIENKLKELLGKENSEWQTASGVMTTFTREHVAFREQLPKDEKDKWPLKEEVGQVLGDFAADGLRDNWNPSIAPLEWLQSKWFSKCLIKGYRRVYCWAFKHHKPEQELLPAMQHLQWLIRVYLVLYVLWVALLVVALLKLLF